jgi:hypothetical protein
MPEPVWHNHSIGEIPAHCHAHPRDFPGHEHRGYMLVREIGQAPRLTWHGFGGGRLPGEVTPAEVLLIDGSDAGGSMEP